jgi:hypothetical protein
VSTKSDEQLHRGVAAAESSRPHQCECERPEATDIAWMQCPCATHTPLPIQLADARVMVRRLSTVRLPYDERHVTDLHCADCDGV